MSAGVQNVNTRDPFRLSMDLESDALSRRDVYTQRAIDALSSPWQALTQLLDSDLVPGAFATLQKHARQMADCCTTAHPVPILARLGPAGEVVKITEAKVAPHHCGRPLCTRCERRSETHAKSAMRLGAALTGALLADATPRFMTLTVRNGATLAPTLDHLNAAALALRKEPEWSHHVSGGMRALEVTHNDGHRRRLKHAVARQHGLMRDRGTYVEETKTRKHTDGGGWVTTTRRRTVDESDARAYLDALHDSGADVYHLTPWERRRCSKHGEHGCAECDPRGWHPHHHLLVQGRYWLSVCECCDQHQRHNCHECRAVNARRRQLHRAGAEPDTIEPERTFSRTCGGHRTRAQLRALRRRGMPRRRPDESKSDYSDRLKRSGIKRGAYYQAFDWLEKTSRGQCRRSQLQAEIANEHRLATEKNDWSKRRMQTIARLQRKLANVPRWEDTAPARCLSCLWGELTGGSHIVDLRPVIGWRESLAGKADVQAMMSGVRDELLKYLTKAAVMPASAMVEFAWTMRRRRRVAWFGSWQGLETEKPEPTELRCGTTWEELWGAWQQPGPYHRLYFKGPETLCLAATAGVADTYLARSPDLPPTWLVGSVPLSTEMAATLYRRAASLVPERAPPTPVPKRTEGAEGLPPPTPPEQSGLPF